MSKAGKFVKKHPWEAAAIGATVGLGGAGIAGAGPLAGLLGGEAGLSTVAGADPAFLGGTTSLFSGESVSPFAGIKDAAGVAKAKIPGLMQGMGKAQMLRLLGSQPQGMTPMSPPQAPQGNVMATTLYPDQPPPEIARDPQLLAMWNRRKQGGYA